MIDKDIKKAIEVLKKGGVILYPTDTIWGIGCDATNPEAVKRVYEIKQREDSKAMLVLLDNPNRLNSYVAEVPDIAWNLMETTDRPMTIIYPEAKNLAPNLVNTDGTIGIRITNEDFSNRLIFRFRKPIVSTSANYSGKAPPENFAAINPEIIRAVDYVVTYRQEDTTPAKPSSIIKVGLGGEVKVLRT